MHSDADYIDVHVDYTQIALILDTISFKDHIMANGNAIIVWGHEYQTDGYLQHYKRYFDNKKQALEQAQKINDFTRNKMAVVVGFNDQFTIYERYDWQKKTLNYRINGELDISTFAIFLLLSILPFIYMPLLYKDKAMKEGW